MAEWRRGREAGLARVDLPPVFGREAVELEHLDGKVRVRGEHFSSDLGEAIALGHFARACVLASRRTADQENARRSLRIVVAKPCRRDRRARREPIHGDVVVGIVKALTGLARARALAMMAVGFPRRRDDTVELARQGIEGPILKLSEEPASELRFVELDIGRALARSIFAIPAAVVGISVARFHLPAPSHRHGPREKASPMSSRALTTAEAQNGSREFPTRRHGSRGTITLARSRAAATLGPKHAAACLFASSRRTRPIASRSWIRTSISMRPSSEWRSARLSSQRARHLPPSAGLAIWRALFASLSLLYSAMSCTPAPTDARRRRGRRWGEAWIDRVRLLLWRRGP